jgi:tetratricopeptide (TPR) repeat protein
MVSEFSNLNLTSQFSSRRFERSLLVVGFVSILALAPTARANDATDCTQTKDPSLAIRACTARIETLRKLQGGLVTGLIAGGYFGDKAIADAYNNRGNAFNVTGDYQRALADYEQAVALAPGEALYYVNRGTARGNLGDLSQAMSDFNEALALRHEFPEALYTRALAFLKTGDHARALADAERAVRLIPGNAQAMYTRGQVYAALGRIEEAVVDFRAALSKEPRLSGASDAIRRLGFSP